MLRPAAAAKRCTKLEQRICKQFVSIKGGYLSGRESDLR